MLVGTFLALDPSGVNPSIETPELAPSVLAEYSFSPSLHFLRVSTFRWLNTLYGCGTVWINTCHRVLERLRQAVAQR